MGHYKLTADAEQDLKHIYAWGYEAFGEGQADKYFMGLLDQFEVISANPLQFQKVDYLFEGARRAVHGRDSIYFTIEETYTLIIGVVGQQDLDHRF